MFKTKSILSAMIIATLAIIPMACKKGDDNTNGSSSNTNTNGKTTISIKGSDTMLNLAIAWKEAYTKTNPNIDLEISGGGSGVGISKLIEGTIQLANASRKIKSAEQEKVKAKFKTNAVEHIVGMDALAVYVHKDNPMDTISIEELAGIYGEGGTTEKWSQLGIKNTACSSDEITRVSRQNSSGTYAYFKEAILGKRGEYKQGASAQSGSKDVVEMVSNTPCAIGYSGMGYKTDHVKFLKVSKKKGEPGILPSIQASQDGSYPVARPLLMYTVGEPTGELKKFIDWCKSPEGQKFVSAVGYVPIK